MSERGSQTGRIRPGEGRIVFALAFLLTANSLALELADVVAISGFLSEVAAKWLLIVWVVDMLIILLTAGLQTLIVDRFKRISLMRWMTLTIAVAYSLLRLLFFIPGMGWLNYSLLYLLSDQQWLFFPLLFWVLANDIFDMSQAKRLFPLITIGGFVGQVLGLGIAALSPAILEALHVQLYEILFLNIFLYVATYLVIVKSLSHLKVRETRFKHESVKETLTEGFGFVKEVPAFRSLMLAMFAMAIVTALVEFRFLNVSDAAITNSGQFQTFYSLYRLGVVFAAILVQSLATSRIIEKIELKNTFLIFPFTVLVSLLGMIGIPGLASSTAGLSLTRLSQETIDESARKAFQALVPEERRGRVSMFMESYLLAAGTILGCGVAGIAIFISSLTGGTFPYFYVYLSVAVVCTVLAIWAIFRMRKSYDTSMFNWRLKRRQRGASVLDDIEF